MDIMSNAIEGYRDIDSEIKIGIFGNPIKHTLSPIIHDNLSDMLGLDERYIAFQIEENLDYWAKKAFAEGILGLNITVPYKQDIMASLVDIDPAAKAIGAVNTLVRCENGYKGYNTDMPGLTRAIKENGIELAEKNIIMLGAGGAARAVAYMCGSEKASSVYIINRTVKKAEDICSDMGKLFADTKFVPVSLEERDKIPADKYVMLQCTSVGLKESDGLPLIEDESFYDMAEAGVDLIYNPAKTRFIKTLEEKGCKCMNGLKMLLYQGILAYQLWNNVVVSDEQAEFVYGKLCEKLYGTDTDSMKTKTEKKPNIVLTGYMGSGKTTVGRAICEKYGMNFLDTDEYIVDKMKMSINDIFAKYGESKFREIETESLLELAEKLENTVVSTGGGVPLKEENRNILKKIGKVYYLKANADTIYNRVKDCTDRPLLRCANPYEKICGMIKERNPLYEMGCDIVVSVDDLSVDDIVEYTKLN